MDPGLSSISVNSSYMVPKMIYWNVIICHQLLKQLVRINSIHTNVNCEVRTIFLYIMLESIYQRYYDWTEHMFDLYVISLLLLSIFENNDISALQFCCGIVWCDGRYTMSKKCSNFQITQTSVSIGVPVKSFCVRVICYMAVTTGSV